ncbi:MCP four helix bundle domain-containing protein, partial [Acinetobacter baumannii]
PRGKELIGALNQSRDEYSKHRAKVVELIQQQKKDEAPAYLFDQTIPVQDKYFAALKNLAEFQVSLMDKAVERANDASSNAVNIM